MCGLNGPRWNHFIFRVRIFHNLCRENKCFLDTQGLRRETAQFSFKGKAGYSTRRQCHLKPFANNIVCHFVARTFLDGMTGDPPFSDIERWPDDESQCKVWWNSNCGVLFKWIYNFIREICKFSGTLVPPMWTGWLVPPLFILDFQRGF